MYYTIFFLLSLSILNTLYTYCYNFKINYLTLYIETFLILIIAKNYIKKHIYRFFNHLDMFFIINNTYLFFLLLLIPTNAPAATKPVIAYPVINVSDVCGEFVFGFVFVFGLITSTFFSFVFSKITVAISC